MHKRSFPIALLILTLATSLPSRAKAVDAAPARPLSATELEFFERKVRPLLAERCYKCHSNDAGKVKGGLLLDTRAGLLKGGDSGPAIIPGDVEKSRLITAVRYHDKELQMPPKEALTREEVAVLEQWVKMGAPDPRQSNGPVARPPAYDYEKARKFWSYQPIRQHPIPAVKDQAWVKNPIDAFVLAKLEEKDLRVAKDLDKRSLIRRATFDLIGLPPTPDEVEAFLNDNSANAFEKVIDRLLASPHYGEKWGRHWLDLVRYADTSGCNSDFPVPQAYKYRNYVINAFNHDKPYDRFIREQIAGDLLDGEEATKTERLTATGYLAIARRFGSRNNEFHLTIEDMIDNMGKVMLGLSVSCARCHDHKFDPIPQSDFYAIYGILNSTRYSFPGTEIYRTPRDLITLAPADKLPELREDEAEIAKLPDTIEKLQSQKNGIISRQNKLKKAATQPTSRALLLADAGVTPGAGTNNKLAAIAAADRPTTRPTTQPADTLEELAKKLVEVNALLGEALSQQKKVEARAASYDKYERIYGAFEGTPANAKIQKKGDPKLLGDEVARGFLQVLGGQTLPRTVKGSGRLQLAGWITDSGNPLTARVMVNRIWQYHFGKGIVQTPNDFGSRGKAPTHPELLDYLATQFMQNGWSIKAMHKAIMLSHAYRMSSDDDPHNAAIDVNNDYLWRFDRRRLSAEEIRDSMLFVSGTLDEAMGAAHPFPAASEWHYTQHKPFYGDYDSRKRTVYLMQQRIKKQPFLDIFDGADTNATTAGRAISTTPLQALYVMNDPLAFELADQFAVRVGMTVTEQDERVQYFHQLAFGRNATEEELSDAREYLSEAKQRMKEAGLPRDRQIRAALASYARMLFASNEFFFID